MSIKGPDGPEDEKPDFKPLLASLQKMEDLIGAHEDLLTERDELQARVKELEATPDHVEAIDDLRDTMEESCDCLLKIKSALITAGVTVPREVYHCIDRCDLVLRSTENATD